MAEALDLSAPPSEALAQCLPCYILDYRREVHGLLIDGVPGRQIYEAISRFRDLLQPYTRAWVFAPEFIPQWRAALGETFPPMRYGDSHVFFEAHRQADLLIVRRTDTGDVFFRPTSRFLTMLDEHLLEMEREEPSYALSKLALT